MMYFQHVSQVNTFCSKACYHEHMRKQLPIVDDGPAMPPLDASRITDEGYVALAKAIVKQASRDVTNHKPGTQVRVQAEKFFESEYFSNLTGLDGEAILRDLRKGKNKKETREKKHTRKVLCLDTGVTFNSIADAGRTYKCSPHGIRDVCAKRRKTFRGMRWEYVEE